MEIKKYVLLETKEIWEVSLVNDKIYGFGSGGVVLKNHVDILGNNYKPYSQVIKTSDNILDLVEVGDLVELFFQGNSEYNINRIEKITDTEIYFERGLYSKNALYGKILSRKLSKYVNVIKAIYKKQPNGDYKRYEVEE